MAGLLTFSFPGAFPSSDPETINSNRNKTVAWYARKKQRLQQRVLSRIYTWFPIIRNYENNSGTITGTNILNFWTQG